MSEPERQKSNEFTLGASPLPQVPKFYVDMANFQITSYSVMLTAGHLAPNDKGSLVRVPDVVIQMSPHFAKVLAHLLMVHVAEFETKMGPLPAVEKIMYPEGRPK